MNVGGSASHAFRAYFRIVHVAGVEGLDDGVHDVGESRFESVGVLLGEGMNHSVASTTRHLAHEFGQKCTARIALLALGSTAAN